MTSQMYSRTIYLFLLYIGIGGIKTSIANDVIYERTGIACEEYLLLISCHDVGKNSRMEIVNANYGRMDNETCFQRYTGQFWNTNCSNPNSTNIVKKNCSEDTQNCSIWAINSVFGDPCPGTGKYLNVTYRCISGFAEDKVCSTVHDVGLTWSQTKVNNTDHQPCPGNKTGFCSRICSADEKGFPTWKHVNCNSCISPKFKELLEQFDRVENGTGDKTKQLAKIAKALSVLTNDTFGLVPGDLNASVRAIVRLTNIREDRSSNPNRDEIESVVQTISNLIHTNNSNAWETLRMANRTIAAALLWSAEVYGSSLVLALDQRNNTTIREVAEHMVIEGTSLETGNVSSEFRFPSTETDDWYGKRKDWISLPTATLALNWNKSRATSLKIWASYYRNMEAYLPGTGDATLDSRILSLSIDGLKKGHKLSKPITITLHHNMEDKSSVRKHARHCVFWEFDSSGGGNWSEEGCKVKTFDSENTVCICDHLTNFAILISQNPSDDIILDHISSIGCIISAIALILTVIVYAVTWKQAKSDWVQATVLMNLCVALIIANVIFLAGADKVDSKIWCTVVAALLHYFFLAAFFLMLVEGIELLLHVIFVFHDRSKTETTMLIIAAWILPLIIVAISLGVTQTAGYGSEKICWLAIEKGLIWAFIGPIVCIIVVNLIVMVVVLKKLCTGRISSIRKQQTTKIGGMLWNASVICPITGVAWVFGILCVSFNDVVFQYIFVIANSLQGLFIFIFHVLFHNKEIKEKLSAVFSQLITCGQNARTKRTKEGTAKKTPGAKDSIALESHGPGQKSNVYAKPKKETGTNVSTTFSSSVPSDTDCETITSSITAEIYTH